MDTDISPYIETNGGLANIYPSAYERELKRCLHEAELEIRRHHKTFETISELCEFAHERGFSETVRAIRNLVG